MADAPNIEAIRDWLRRNRPDTLGTVDDIIQSTKDQPGGRADGLLWFLVAGFSAGRQYQIDHPELGVHSFHSDDPRLPKKGPVKTDDTAIVHILMNGAALCGQRGTPSAWPAGHKWVSFESVDRDIGHDDRPKLCPYCVENQPHKTRRKR